MSQRMKNQVGLWADARRAFLWITAAAVIGACTETSAPDVTPPAVTSVSPTDGTAAIPISATISATFSEAMDPTSITTSTVTLKRTSSGATVAGTVTYSSATKTASFAPAAPLLNTTGYTFGITTAAKDVAGNALASAFSSSFTTVQNVSGAPNFQGSDVPDRIHFHIRFTQSGQTLGLPTDCQPLPLADCEVFPHNQDGVDAVGPPSPNQNGGSIITALTGTFNDPNISFTFTIANGRTFTYTGTVTGSNTMTGTIGGTTLSSATLVLTR
ncbi:MAG TPA: Ig-like domain-containing protein [Gemmatimonadaceae bacterium]